MWAISKKETTKKFIEKQIKRVLTDEYVKVLKRNPGHIALVEVETIPSSELIKIISKFCKEKIEFKLRDETEACMELYIDFEKKEIRRETRRINRKAKKTDVIYGSISAPERALYAYAKKGLR